MQNKVPKVTLGSLAPAEYPSNEDMEWCPPGHGDLYTALYDTGKLEELIAQGYDVLFVSNADNLGATLDLDLLTYFTHLTNAPFMMECLVRSENDKKGGHLCMRSSDGQLILRESAMCAKEDKEAFESIELHRYFNTNNLWVRLNALKDLMNKNQGFVPLPTIFNGKTVNPTDPKSAKVVQLETAMGSAIECFQGSIAVCVSKERFAPVKKCSDLLLLRSDAYTVDENFVLTLDRRCDGRAPIINLEDEYYKMVPQIEEATKNGTPSLLRCTKLTVNGNVHFSRGNIFIGEVTIINPDPTKQPKTLPDGTYENITYTIQ
jgi:UDP-N-acetylglucosamine pyrophosphorylase